MIQCCQCGNMATEYYFVGQEFTGSPEPVQVHLCAECYTEMMEEAEDYRYCESEMICSQCGLRYRPVVIVYKNGDSVMLPHCKEEVR